jgi:hypothetical protein
LRQVKVYTTDKDYNHFIELTKNLHYVKKIVTGEEDPSKEEILNGIKQAIKEVKMVKASRLKARPLKELIDEL